MIWAMTASWPGGGAAAAAPPPLPLSAAAADRRAAIASVAWRLRGGMVCAGVFGVDFLCAWP